MPSPRARHIPQLLEIHAEDLAFLWGQRREVLDSPEHTLRDYANLNERIEAHLQGLLVASPAALCERLGAMLAAGGDRDDIFAASYAALRCNEPIATQQVVVEFSRAAGPALAGLRDAMGLAPPAPFADELRRALEQAKPTTAASAAAALANHQLLDAGSPQLAKLLLDEDQAVCALAWQATRLADVRVRQQTPTRPYKRGLAHAQAPVRHAAWACAAWTGQAVAMSPLREAAASGDRVALQWLAVLGNADDAQLLGKAALAIDDPNERCALLARYGHPVVLNALLRWIGGEDAALAQAAGEAFTRITGEDIRGERRTLPVAAGADEFEREMAPLVWMPDAMKARDRFEQGRVRWAEGTRWHQGLRLDTEPTPETLRTLDLQARWDAAARAAMMGRALSAPPPICS